jgi:hypothetical protein
MLAYFIDMTHECQIKQWPYPIGSKFTCENLNVEFKKVVLEFKTPTIKNDERIHVFLKKGVITEDIQKILMSSFTSALRDYIPKYTTCFLNTDHILSHRESFLYMGIDDNGIINGIPFNKNIITPQEICDEISNIIDDSINKKIVNDENIKQMIKNCLSFNIFLFDKTKKSFFESKMRKNFPELEKLKQEINKLNVEFDELTKSKNELEILNENINQKIYIKSHNSGIVDKLFTYIIKSKDFPIRYDNNNPEHRKFMRNVMTNFDPITNGARRTRAQHEDNVWIIDDRDKNTQTSKHGLHVYDRNYENNIARNNDIEFYIRTNDGNHTLGTLFYEKIKKFVDRIREKTSLMYTAEKQKEITLEKIKNDKYSMYESMYYDLDIYYNIINYHNENMYFIVRLIFDTDKYKKYFEGDIVKVGYYNEKNEKVFSKRDFKIGNNKIEPECVVNI